MNIQQIACEFLSSLGSSNAQLMWQASILIFISALAFITLTPRNSSSPKKSFIQGSFLGSDTLFLIISISMVFIGNLPSLSRYECSVDESEWMASAITLKENPEFWVKYHLHWTRPLTVIPIYLLEITGVGIDYGSVKGLRTLLIVLTGIVLFGTIRRITNSHMAKVCTLPYFALYAVMTHSQIAAYNSEAPTMLIIAISVYLWFRLSQDGDDAGHLLITCLGILVGSIFLAKQQAIPVGIIIGMTSLYILRNHLRKLILLLCAATAPLAMLASWLTFNGTSQELLDKYFNSMHYTNVGVHESNMKFTEKVIIGLRMIYKFHDTRFFSLGLTLSFIALFWIVFTCKLPKKSFIQIKCIFTILLPLVSFICVCLPGNAHYYYLNFLPFPFCVCLAVFWGFTESDKKTAVSIRNNNLISWTICLGTTILPTVVLVANGNESFEHLATNTYLGSRVDPIPDQIQKNSRQHDSLAIWGYLPRIHVESKRSLGVRFSTPYNIVKNYPSKGMMLKSYAYDLVHNKPLYFLDATGPGHHNLNKVHHHFSHFPTIKKIVDRNYSLVADFDQMQLFKRQAVGGNPKPK